MVFPLMKLFLVGIICLSRTVADPSRKVTTVFWPNCDDFPKACHIYKALGDNVVYSKASTPSHDDLHYIFSTISIPTAIVVRTTRADAQMYLDWDKMQSSTNFSDCISFKNTTKQLFHVDYRFGVAFTKLIEYNDKDDAADLNHCDANWKSCDFTIRSFKDFVWDPLPDNATDNSFIFNTTTDMLDPSVSNNGSLSFSFVVRDQDGRASELPALRYSSNETMFDFVMSNYTPSYSKSRFALETVVVSSSKPDKMLIDGTKSIDDEYSPGVFKIVNWQADHQNEASTGFVQWKPVSYLSESRGRKAATEVVHYKLLPMHVVTNSSEDETQVNESLLYPLFKATMFDDSNVAMRLTNLSFGITKDDFYLKNNYTAWSAAFGYGTPPEDEISSMVIIVIAAGLGIPVLIIIFGGIYTICRKVRRQGGYEPISGRGSNLQIRNPESY